jgi:hypothetical protein
MLASDVCHDAPSCWKYASIDVIFVHVSFHKDPCKNEAVTQECLGFLSRELHCIWPHALLTPQVASVSGPYALRSRRILSTTRKYMKYWICSFPSCCLCHCYVNVSVDHTNSALPVHNWYDRMSIKSVSVIKMLFFLLFLVGWDWVHLVLRPLLAYCTSPRW